MEKLTEGVIDGYAIRTFMHGACGALALALHDVLGWDLIAVTDAHNVHDGAAGGGSSMHYMVRHPGGMLLDIRGLHEDDEILDDYHGYADDGEAALGTSDRADVEEWYIHAQGEPVSVDFARSFVAPLLKRIGHGE